MKLTTLPTLLTLLASATTLVSSAPTINKRQSTTQIHKFTSPTSAEGIAQRPNGALLITFFDKGELWTLDPSTKKTSKLATFPDATCTGAITEISPDIFAVVAGQFSFGGGNKPGSWAVWKVDFTKVTTTGGPVVEVIKKIPESTFFNGITTLDNSTVLVGDAGKGAVYRLDVNTGVYSVAIQDVLMAPPSGQPMGIDGLRYVNGTIYFTNVMKNTFHKVAVDATGKATGPIANIWSGTMADDLWVTPDGTSYVATGSANKIQKVTSDNKISTIASISGSTAVLLGRTEADKNTLYITTGSGVIASIKV